MPAGLRLCVTAALFLLLPALTAAAQKSLSKSVEQGWNSVIKDASKAARQVSKAANDALGPKKGRKKKVAKRKDDEGKSEPKETAAKPSDATKPTKDDAAEAEAEAWASEPERAARRKGEPNQPEARKSARSEPAPKETPPANEPPRKPAQTWTAERAPGEATDKPKGKPAIPSVNIVPIRSKDANGGKGHAEPEPDPPQKLPITMIPPKPETKDGQPAPPEAWSKEEIESAKANCTAVLKRVDAVTIPEAPVREGDCGTPAPVRLVSIGKDPQVALSPPPLVTCDLVVGLHDWMKNDIQPLARKQFGGPVIKIETMSDYSCRMAYGRKGNKLSEHGRANAVDIRGFVTGKGETAYLLEHWGKTVRDLAAEAAAQAAAKQAADEAADAAAAAGAKSATVQDKSKITVSLPAGAARSTSQSNLGSIGLRKRGTTDEQAAKLAEPVLNPEPKSKKAQFLHEAQKSACRIFGTTLGPESNDAHRNHFHVDMAARKRTKICE